MKKKTKLALAIAVTSVIGTAAIAAVSCEKLKNGKITLPEGFTVTAHTGCEGAADNSLEAITRGYEAGADIVEFDLNFDKKGNPVLAHDAADKNSVTLDDAFGLIAQYESLKVNVDCKKTVNLTEVKALAEKHGILDRIFYTGIEEKDVAAVKAQTPDVAYYLNVPVEKIGRDKKSISALADKIKALGAVGINIKYTGCSKKLIEIFREKGLLVSVWTVNSDFEMYITLPKGADNITSRQPTKLIGQIKARQE